MDCIENSLLHINIEISNNRHFLNIKEIIKKLYNNDYCIEIDNYNVVSKVDDKIDESNNINETTDFLDNSNNILNIQCEICIEEEILNDIDDNIDDNIDNNINENIKDKISCKLISNVLGKANKIYSNSNLITNNEKCIICMQNYKNREFFRLLPNCNHVYHKKCIDKWLKNNLTCPICRFYYII